MRRTLLVAVLSAVILCSQTQIVSIAEITGDAAAHQIATTGSARWIQFIAPAGNSAVVRIGDSNTSSTRGLPVAAGGGLLLPNLSPGQPGYALSQVYYYAATGDKLDITWGK